MNLGNKLCTHFLLFLFILCLCSFYGCSDAKDSTIDSLFHTLQEAQFKRDREFIPIVQEKEVKGIFPAHFRLNFHGNPEYTFLRHTFGVLDNNAFVTSWIIQVLLEAHKLGSIDLTSSPQILDLGLGALENYRDFNYENGTPLYDFWQQRKNGDVWIQYPDNLMALADESGDIGPYIKTFLEDLGLGYIWKEIAEYFSLAAKAKESFELPGDSDDTGVNIAVGMHLKTASDLQEYYNTWKSYNHNFSAYAHYTYDFAYKPFSSDHNINGIDPRSYFWMREFLEEAEGKGSLAIVTTWLENQDQTISLFDKGVRMPFNSNNVDASVCANAIYAIIMSVLNMEDEELVWFDSDIQGLLLNTTNLLSWTVETEVMSKRPDLALLYYPPIYNFFWFISRSVFELRGANPERLGKFPVLTQVRDVLTKAMESGGTKQIQDVQQTDGTYVYWDDFLGDADVNWFDEVVVHGEDRLFSTAVSANALMDTWTTSSSSCKRTWIDSTPDEVKASVKGAISWLRDEILKTKYRPENAFFSGSVKGFESLPFFYPATLLEYFNGTKINPRDNLGGITDKMLDLMQNTVSKEKYDQFLNETWFGVNVPQKFAGYNEQGNTLGYWSSPSLTHALGILAFSKFENLC